MGTTSNICCHSDIQPQQQQPKERQFLDREQSNKMQKQPLIDMIRAQYDDQLLPNVRELQKHNKNKVLKLLDSPTTTQKNHKKESKCRISPSKPQNNPQKNTITKEELHSYNDLIVLKQKCEQIAQLQQQLFKRCSPKKINFNIQKEEQQRTQTDTINNFKLSESSQAKILHNQGQ